MIRIHEIGSYALRNYLLETEIGWIAIDTGYPGGCEAFVKRFEKLAPINELKYIILTHADDDHAGFLTELLHLCPAQVVMHPLAPAVLRGGQNPVPEGAGLSAGDKRIVLRRCGHECGDQCEKTYYLD